MHARADERNAEGKCATWAMQAPLGTARVEAVEDALRNLQARRAESAVPPRWSMLAHVKRTWIHTVLTQLEIGLAIFWLAHRLEMAFDWQRAGRATRWQRAGRGMAGGGTGMDGNGLAMGWCWDCTEEAMGWQSRNQVETAALSKSWHPAHGIHCA